jgi:hypothetical protein
VTQPWTETVQHPGVWGVVGREYHDYCNTCGAILDGVSAAEHCKITGHAGHNGRYISIEGWVTQPWTETIEHPGVWGIIGYR